MYRLPVRELSLEEWCAYRLANYKFHFTNGTTVGAYRKITTRDRKENRKARQHMAIDMAIVRADGSCPICSGERGHGVTCGGETCVKSWLFPYLDRDRTSALEDGVR